MAWQQVFASASTLDESQLLHLVLLQCLLNCFSSKRPTGGWVFFLQYLCVQGVKLTFVVKTYHMGGVPDAIRFRY